LDLEPLEEALWAAAERRFGAGVRCQRDLVRAIKAQSARYTRQHDDDKKLSGPTSLLARALFFTLADVPKPVIALEELMSRYQLVLPPRPRILDVGAGCGAMSFGTLIWLQQHHNALKSVELYALDRDHEALALMTEALDLAQKEERSTLPATKLEVSRIALDRRGATKRALAHKAPYDLVLAGTVLNELPPRESAALVRQLLRQLTPQGVLLITEPALKECTRALHGLRNELIVAGTCHVLLPCTHGGPCPLVAHEDHWCHESRIWPMPPPRMRQIAAACGLRRRDIKFSFLALQRAEGPMLKRHYTMPWRVVGSPGRLKGRAERWICGPLGLHRARGLERHRRAGNESFFTSRRGELLDLGGSDAHQERLLITDETRVEARDPARLWAHEHNPST